MPTRQYKPPSAGRRGMSVADVSEITKTTPERSLLEPRPRSGGRNVLGRMTMRHRGGGHKRRYRVIDFVRNKDGVPAKVAAIEYDPNRSARIALIKYQDGTKAYILAPYELKVGSSVISGATAAPEVGNALPLASIPLGTPIHNIELVPGRGGVVARAAGQEAILSNREGEYALVKMPSGEIRKINAKCYATVGKVGNLEHMNVVSGKAGRTRWLGVRPTVRGMCMNPIDHPNGGGEGRSKSGGGRQHLLSPWGHAKGQKTRNKKKAGTHLIVERRKK